MSGGGNLIPKPFPHLLWSSTPAMHTAGSVTTHREGNQVSGERLKQNPVEVIFPGVAQHRRFSLSRRRVAGMGIRIGDIDIRALLNKMKPFLQKNRIMQNNYDIALNILGRKKSPGFDNPGSRLIPSLDIPHLNLQHGSTS